jgi:hypothetical protein
VEPYGALGGSMEPYGALWSHTEPYVEPHEALWGPM